MEKRKILACILCWGLALSLIGCEKLSEIKFISKFIPKKPAFMVQGTIIAKVNDMPITLEQLNQEIENYNQLVQTPEEQITTLEQKLAYLEQDLVRAYLFYGEAKAEGLDKDAKIQQTLRNLEVGVLANEFVQRQLNNLLVTSSEIEDFYNLYKEEYRQAEERQVREIALNTEAEARDVLIELLKGTDFATLAKERSRSESASRGGSLGFIKKGERGADFSRFDEVVFSPTLEAGQISNIFKDKDGYYIVKVEQIKGGQAKPLSEVWDEIKRNILFLKQQQKLQELNSRLAKDAKIIIYREKIQ